MSVFDCYADHYGVFYPMQTFSREREVNFSEIPCFLEASDNQALELIEQVATSVSQKVYCLSSEQRRYLHLAAVFACNFVNHCYAIACDLLKMNDIPFEVIYPLIDETARKVHVMSPEQAQTGPAVRYDRNVIAKHSEMLQHNQIVREVYDKMSISINQKEKQIHRLIIFYIKVICSLYNLSELRNLNPNIDIRINTTIVKNQNDNI